MPRTVFSEFFMCFYVRDYTTIFLLLDKVFHDKWLGPVPTHYLPHQHLLPRSSGSGLRQDPLQSVSQRDAKKAACLSIGENKRAMVILLCRTGDKQVQSLHKQNYLLESEIFYLNEEGSLFIYSQKK